MTTTDQKTKDIEESLWVAFKVAHVPVLQSEVRAISERLLPYHGAALFRLITALPGRQFFPGGVQIEQEIRTLLGQREEDSWGELRDHLQLKINERLLGLEDFGEIEKSPLDLLSEF